MAIDTKPTLGSTSDLDKPVIENEIPAYRAISARAVASLILGLGSVFCFTSLWFLLLVAGSVLFGWAAIRAIQRLPEIITGTGLARTGMGLGLVFGVSATTQIIAQDLLLTYEASQFAKMYVGVLKNESIALAAWYRQAPDVRKERTPEMLIEELRKAPKNPSSGDLYATETAEISAIKQRLKAPNQEIHFSKIETKLVDGLTQYANALIDLDGPATAEYPDKEQFALLDMMKTPGSGPNDWRIRSIRYPYKPASSGLQTEKKDDGHGH